MCPKRLIKALLSLCYYRGNMSAATLHGRSWGMSVGICRWAGTWLFCNGMTSSIATPGWSTIPWEPYRETRRRIVNSDLAFLVHSVTAGIIPATHYLPWSIQLALCYIITVRWDELWDEARHGLSTFVRLWKEGYDKRLLYSIQEINSDTTSFLKANFH